MNAHFVIDKGTIVALKEEGHSRAKSLCREYCSYVMPFSFSMKESVIRTYRCLFATPYTIEFSFSAGNSTIGCIVYFYLCGDGGLISVTFFINQAEACRGIEGHG